jgi:nicotinate-nucleotide pyrophosphorylase (carboxylating)
MPALPDDIPETVAIALREDVGTGDLTANLIPADSRITAHVITREPAILCGTAWFDEVFRQLDKTINISWSAHDSESIKNGQTICELAGNARAILTGERTALNFLQLLSGTATSTHEYAEILKEYNTKILDTRKTIPGLRTAQKYAVLCGGGKNHRMGLYDAILIKENHKLAAGSITAAIKATKKQGVPIETEVENLAELEQALAAGTDSVLLDNFDLDELREAVAINKGRVPLEASGGVDKEKLRAIAETGVDFISIGSLTKHVRAIDFSMRFTGDR